MYGANMLRGGSRGGERSGGLGAELLSYKYFYYVHQINLAEWKIKSIYVPYGGKFWQGKTWEKILRNDYEFAKFKPSL